MNNDEKQKSRILVIISIIGAFATCMAAIIGLGQPLVSRLVDIYLPQSTSSPVSVLSSSKYQFISLQNLGISESGNLGLQAGKQTLANVDFQIGWLVTTQSEEAPNNADKIIIDVQQSAIEISKVHFLLQAGWSTIPDKEIGEITIVFADGHRLSETLKVGYNIRDWSEVNSSLTAPNIHQAWRGIGWDGSRPGVVDMLTINVPDEYSQIQIAQFELQDTSMEKLNSLSPAIHLWAITMEQ